MRRLIYAKDLKPGDRFQMFPNEPSTIVRIDVVQKRIEKCSKCRADSIEKIYVGVRGGGFIFDPDKEVWIVGPWPPSESGS